MARFWGLASLHTYLSSPTPMLLGGPNRGRSQQFRGKVLLIIGSTALLNLDGCLADVVIRLHFFYPALTPSGLLLAFLPPLL